MQKTFGSQKTFEDPRILVTLLSFSSNFQWKTTKCLVIDQNKLFSEDHRFWGTSQETEIFKCRFRVELAPQRGNSCLPWSSGLGRKTTMFYLFLTFRIFPTFCRETRQEGKSCFPSCTELNARGKSRGNNTKRPNSENTSGCFHAKKGKKSHSKHYPVTRPFKSRDLFSAGPF